MVSRAARAKESRAIKQRRVKLKEELGEVNKRIKKIEDALNTEETRKKMDTVDFLSYSSDLVKLKLKKGEVEAELYGVRMAG